MARFYSRLTLAALLALACAFSCASALPFMGKKASAGEVLVIDGTKSFEDALKAHDFLVVEFYAPVSGPWRATAAHCYDVRLSCLSRQLRLNERATCAQLARAHAHGSDTRVRGCG